MEENNRVDELIGVWTTIVFGERMTLNELSNSPRLRELSFKQFETLDTLLSSQLCAGRIGVKRCPVCPNSEDSLLRCHLVVRYIEDEMEEVRQGTTDAPPLVQQMIQSRLSEVQYIIHRYMEDLEAHELPAKRMEQRQTS
jgi:hypothetical protein